MIRFLLACVFLYWLWSISLEMTAIRKTLEQVYHTRIEVPSPFGIAHEWVNSQPWLHPEN